MFVDIVELSSSLISERIPPQICGRRVWFNIFRVEFGESLVIDQLALLNLFLLTVVFHLIVQIVYVHPLSRNVLAELCIVITGRYLTFFYPQVFVLELLPLLWSFLVAPLHVVYKVTPLLHLFVPYGVLSVKLNLQ